MTKISKNKVKNSLSVIMIASLALILFTAVPLQTLAYTTSGETMLIAAKPDQPPGQTKKSDRSSYNPKKAADESPEVEDVLDIGDEEADEAPGQSEDAPGQQKQETEEQDVTDEGEDQPEPTQTEEETATTADDEKGKETAPGQDKKETDEESTEDSEEDADAEEDDTVGEEVTEDDDDDTKGQPHKTHKVEGELEEDVEIEEPEASIFLAQEETVEDIDFGLAFSDVPMPCRPGNLIKTTGKETVYYCARDGKRYLFPHRKVFMSWFHDFSAVMTIDSDVLYSIPLGGVITYRPGIKMLKTQDDAKTFAVAKGRTLRWVENETVAEKLYGENWNEQIDDVTPDLMNEYAIGEPIGLAEAE